LKVAVTGAKGFVGSHLVRYLTARGHDVFVLDWRSDLAIPAGAAVVHAAGLAHRRGRQTPSEAEFEAGNVSLTKRVATAARSANASIFIFVSSIAVVAGNSGILKPDMPAAPLNAYGRSKMRAEALLREFPDINPVIIRPPLVYGPGAKGNMAALTRFAVSPLPSPFGAIKNARTLVCVENLASAIEHLIEYDTDERYRIYHVTDAEAATLANIIADIRKGAGRRAMQVNLAPSAIRVPLRILGLRQIAEQLTGDLLVDGSTLFGTGWHPPQTARQGFEGIGRSLA
jgi:UDP-glucose 4-epimerase